MYKLYYLVSESTKFYYIGMTGNSLKYRMNGHRCSCSRGIKTPLYDCMRKYNDFIIVLVDEFETREECAKAEKEYIESARQQRHKILNLADGGDGGFVVKDKESWRKKLSEKRRGLKPALGMKHTEENKKLFSEVSKQYWSTQQTYDAETVCSLPFKEANELHGISRTHYYRLKRSLSNEQ